MATAGDGIVDKAAVEVHGRSLLEHVVSVARQAGATQVIVVGPPRRVDARLKVTRVQEEPPGGGPRPAIATGLGAVVQPETTVVVLLAADLPFLDAGSVGYLRSELAAAPPGVPGVVAQGGGRPQWLLSAWRRPVLAAALGPGGEPEGTASLHALFEPLGPVTVPLDDNRDGPAWIDCDTPEDLARARRRRPVAKSPRGESNS